MQINLLSPILHLRFEATLPDRRAAVLVIRGHFDLVMQSHLPVQVCLAEALCRKHHSHYESAVHLHSWPPTHKSTSLCGRFALIFIIINSFSYSEFMSLVVFFIPLPSHTGILMSSKPTAARARTTPTLGGPQGLNS